MQVQRVEPISDNQPACFSATTLPMAGPITNHDAKLGIMVGWMNAKKANVANQPARPTVLVIADDAKDDRRLVGDQIGKPLAHLKFSYGSKRLGISGDFSIIHPPQKKRVILLSDRS